MITEDMQSNKKSIYINTEVRKSELLYEIKKHSNSSTGWSKHCRLHHHQQQKHHHCHYHHLDYVYVPVPMPITFMACSQICILGKKIAICFRIIQSSDHSTWVYHLCLYSYIVDDSGSRSVCCRYLPSFCISATLFSSLLIIHVMQLYVRTGTGIVL